MSNTNTEALSTAYEKLQEAIENADLSNYATTSDLIKRRTKLNFKRLDFPVSFIITKVYNIRVDTN